MRKLSLLLFLASTAVPALAQSSDDGERQSRREARAEQSQDRPQRAERPERTERMEQRERPQREVQVERQVQVEQQDQGDGARGERMQRHQEQMQQRQMQQEQQQQAGGSRGDRMQRYREQMERGQEQPDDSTARLERYRQRQIEAGQQGGGLVPRERRVRTIPTIQPEVGQVGPVRTDVRRDVRDNHRFDRDRRNGWTNNWRNDRRYDWRNYRNRHRSTFSMGFYFDPFGFNYSRFGIGSYLYPNYYQSNYWISDPWQYRLPPAYGPYRWIRYHNDAILIDTYTGEVEDVIYGFFW